MDSARLAKRLEEVTSVAAATGIPLHVKKPRAPRIQLKHKHKPPRSSKGESKAKTKKPKKSKKKAPQGKIKSVHLTGAQAQAVLNLLLKK